MAIGIALLVAAAVVGVRLVTRAPAPRSGAPAPQAAHAPAAEALRAIAADPEWDLALERTKGDRWRVAWPAAAGAEIYRLVVRSSAGETVFETATSATEIVVADSALPHAFHKRRLSIHAEAVAGGSLLRASPEREISFGDDCKHE